MSGAPDAVVSGPEQTDEVVVPTRAVERRVERVVLPNDQRPEKEAPPAVAETTFAPGNEQPTSPTPVTGKRVFAAPDGRVDASAAEEKRGEVPDGDLQTRTTDAPVPTPKPVEEYEWHEALPDSSGASIDDQNRDPGGDDDTDATPATPVLEVATPKPVAVTPRPAMPEVTQQPAIPTTTAAPRVSVEIGKVTIVAPDRPAPKIPSRRTRRARDHVIPLGGA